MIHTSSCSRSVLCSWLFLWLISIPLFHIHYERDALPAQTSHNGIVHTIFSRDLPGEMRLPIGPGSSFRTNVPNYPELGFSYLKNGIFLKFSDLTSITPAQVPDSGHPMGLHFHDGMALKLLSGTGSPLRGPPSPLL